jgi:hypothetical protein
LNIRFLEDVWLGEEPVTAQYPSLYNIVERKKVTVANFFASVPLNIGFRRNLKEHKWDRWPST